MSVEIICGEFQLRMFAAIHWNCLLQLLLLLCISTVPPVLFFECRYLVFAFWLAIGRVALVPWLGAGGGGTCVGEWTWSLQLMRMFVLQHYEAMALVTAEYECSLEASVTAAHLCSRSLLRDTKPRST